MRKIDMKDLCMSGLACMVFVLVGGFIALEILRWLFWAAQ